MENNEQKRSEMSNKENKPRNSRVKRVKQESIKENKEITEEMKIHIEEKDSTNTDSTNTDSTTDINRLNSTNNTNTDINRLNSTNTTNNNTDSTTDSTTTNSTNTTTTNNTTTTDSSTTGIICSTDNILYDNTDISMINMDISCVKVYLDSISVINTLKETKVMIITPLKKDVLCIQNRLNERQVLVKRVLEGIEALDEVDVNCVIINKFRIIKEMGLISDLITAIGNRRIIAVLEEEEDDLEELKDYKLLTKKLSRRVFYVKGSSIFDRMAMIFALTKARPIKNLCILVGTPREERRVEVFLQSFGIAVKLSPDVKTEGVVGIFSTHRSINTEILQKYSLVLDISGSEQKSLDTIKASVLRMVAHTENEDARFKKILEQAMTYKYRIDSVIQLITPKILKRRGEIEASIVKHLQGPLRLI
ncbi:hypothetical protein NEPAR08_2149 [Nematocida parisii]|uniref:Uncharacterized protein n=1 Tax=Nematocida parisii (strain ERTm3) TaxID=935791 RepID=I3EDK6_NEMP3|nr:hypothetical protein NEQG_02426 [Nematocida parisii ERTm3]KAI5129561.1 hypothetical protein NEPAR03_1724 [Nematocida parisii]KAI5130640.1 hypothetical protein NEPAR08_2149 [Nematocida parisii]KAI5143852.1 hypothetical protein NEPAR07_0901 [Nematocida parisii]